MDISPRLLSLPRICGIAICFAMILTFSGASARVVIDYLEFGVKAQAAIQQNQKLGAKLDAAFKLPCIDKKSYDELEDNVMQAANAANELARESDTEVDTRAAAEEGIPIDHPRIDRLRHDLGTTAQDNTDRLDALHARICREAPSTEHALQPTSGGETTASATGEAGAPSDAAAICHQCEWLRVQISDIDDKIASWERQIESIQKHADLSDPKIQGALKDIDNSIATLKAKKAELQAKLADCKKRCADAQRAAPKPAVPLTPGGVTEGGGSTNGNTDGGGSANSADTTPRLLTPKFPTPSFTCPPDAPKVKPVSRPSDKTAVLPPLPASIPLPPAPRDRQDSEDWDNLLLDMQFTELAGDAEDVWDVSKELDEAIKAANDDLAFDPQDDDARERLEWLEIQRNYYDRWKAYIDIKYPTYRLEIVPLKKCYVDPQWQLEYRYKVQPSGEHSNSDAYNPLDHLTIGIGVGGGDRHDDGERKIKPPPSDKPRD